MDEIEGRSPCGAATPGVEYSKGRYASVAPGSERTLRSGRFSRRTGRAAGGVAAQTAADETLTIDPLPCRSMFGRTAR